jgi:hypothetical protein
MKQRKVFATIVASLVVSTTTACDLLPGSGDWNCGAFGGAFQRNSRTVLLGPKTVTGEIYFESTDFSTRFHPTATVTFATSENDCIGCAGLRLNKYQPYPDYVYATLLIGGRPRGEAWLLHKRPTPFKMTIMDDGLLDLEIGRHGIHLKDRAINYGRIFLNSTCSASNVTFRNIEVSRAGS